MSLLSSTATAVLMDATVTDIMDIPLVDLHVVSNCIQFATLLGSCWLGIPSYDTASWAAYSLGVTNDWNVLVLKKIVTNPIKMYSSWNG
jgi:hypothetical protein